ncbi:MAG TPA: DUF6807 family protein [Candidatus Methylomirabilis sp.]
MNGVDCWIETGVVGKILLREIRDVVAGSVFAGWTETKATANETRLEPSIGWRTGWFTRDYGPLLSNFMRFQPYLLAQGEQLRLSFRLYLHDGDAKAARVAEHYTAFKTPPRVEMEARC